MLVSEAIVKKLDMSFGCVTLLYGEYTGGLQRIVGKRDRPENEGE
jgi:hypothetical protein